MAGAPITYKGFTWGNNLPDTNTPVQFLSMEPAQVEHFWDFGDGNTSTAGAPQHTYTTPGFYSVKYTATYNGVSHEYSQKWPVRCMSSRTRAAALELNLANVTMSGAQSDYSKVAAGSLVKVSGQAVHAEGVKTVSRWVISNLKGTKANPIYLYFEPGSLISANTSSSCIIFNGCQNVVLDGAKNLVLENNGGGIDTWNLNDAIEVSGVTIRYMSGTGAKMKNTALDRFVKDANGNYTDVLVPYYRDMMLHNCHIHDVGLEGCYIGDTHFGWWNGIMVHIMQRAKIFRNRVERTGWDGIQLSNAPIGSEIFNNYVESAATKGQGAHSYALQIGMGFGGEVYNNIFIEGPNGLGGTAQQGLGFDSKYYNNVHFAPNGDFALLVMTQENAGQDYVQTDPNVRYDCFGNTFISRNKAVHALFRQPSGNPVPINNFNLRNNAYTAPTLRTWGTVPATNFLETDNIQKSVKEHLFNDAAAHNYHLTAESPAIGGGADISILYTGSEAAEYDHDGVLRTNPQDQGAHRYYTYFIDTEEPQGPEEPVTQWAGNRRLILN